MCFVILPDQRYYQVLYFVIIRCFVRIEIDLVFLH